MVNQYSNESNGFKLILFYPLSCLKHCLRVAASAKQGRAGSYFLLDQKVRQKIKKKRRFHPQAYAHPAVFSGLRAWCQSTRPNNFYIGRSEVD
jgi:hypothetical protein